MFKLQAVHFLASWRKCSNMGSLLRSSLLPLLLQHPLYLQPPPRYSDSQCLLSRALMSFLNMYSFLAVVGNNNNVPIGNCNFSAEVLLIAAETYPIVHNYTSIATTHYWWLCLCSGCAPPAATLQASLSSSS